MISNFGNGLVIKSCISVCIESSPVTPPPPPPPPIRSGSCSELSTYIVDISLLVQETIDIEQQNSYNND